MGTVFLYTMLLSFKVWYKTVLLYENNRLSVFLSVNRGGDLNPVVERDGDPNDYS